MRLDYFATNTLRRTVFDGEAYVRMKEFSDNNFKGGWEVWLQCQSFSMLHDSASYDFTREVKYPTNNQKCDFQIKKIQDNQITLWVELKVQLNRNVHDLIKRFGDDVIKIQDLNLPQESNSLGAIAVVPHDCKDLFTKGNKEYFENITDIYTNNVTYQAIRPERAVIKGQWNETGNLHNFDDSYVVVLSYQLI